MFGLYESHHSFTISRSWTEKMLKYCGSCLIYDLKVCGVAGKPAAGLD